MNLLGTIQRISLFREVNDKLLQTNSDKFKTILKEKGFKQPENYVKSVLGSMISEALAIFDEIGQKMNVKFSDHDNKESSTKS